MLKQVKVKRKAKEAVIPTKEGNDNKRSKPQVQKAVKDTETFQFQEEDNIMELEVSKVTERAEFPTPSKDEEESEESDMEDGELLDSLINNNATIAQEDARLLSASRSPSAAHAE